MTESKTILEPAESKMIKAIDFLREALASIRAGKASPNLLNGITVEYYGNPTPHFSGSQCNSSRCTDGTHSALGEEFDRSDRKGHHGSQHRFNSIK